jgi:hypothetical protein
VDFDGASGKAANITDIFESGREGDHREGAGQLIFAEVEEVNAFGADLYLKNFAGNAFGFADVLAGFVDGDAVGGVEETGREEDQRRDRSPHSR